MICERNLVFEFSDYSVVLVKLIKENFENSSNGFELLKVRVFRPFYTD